MSRHVDTLHVCLRIVHIACVLVVVENGIFIILIYCCTSQSVPSPICVCMFLKITRSLNSNVVQWLIMGFVIKAMDDWWDWRPQVAMQHQLSLFIVIFINWYFLFNLLSVLNGDLK